MKTIHLYCILAVCVMQLVACHSSFQPIATTLDFPDSDERIVSLRDSLLKLETLACYEPLEGYSRMSYRTQAALNLANRVVTMYCAIDYSEAVNIRVWSEAVEEVLAQYAQKHRLPADSAEIAMRDVLSYAGYDVANQASMNEYAAYRTVINTYTAAASYTRLLRKINDPQLRQLFRAEYIAWFEWMDAKYFTNVYLTHADDYYSALPLDFYSYHCYQTYNRLIVLRIEEDILLNGVTYNQRGTTVSTQQWNAWLERQGYTHDMSPEFNMNEPSETHFAALIKYKTERWLAARQAVARYLNRQSFQGKSYDCLTADIHACVIGQIKPIYRLCDM